MEAMQISAADSYELGFNRACALLDQGDYPAAEEQLQLALRAGAPSGIRALGHYNVGAQGRAVGGCGGPPRP